MVCFMLRHMHVHVQYMYLILKPHATSKMYTIHTFVQSTHQQPVLVLLECCLH